MHDLYPVDRRILERPHMLFRPFGKEPTGEPIRDLTGVSIRENVTYLQEVITEKKGIQAGKEIVEELVNLLNSRIPDKTYHTSRKFLQNPWTGYSNEFVAYLVEFCIDLSEDPKFQYHMGERQMVPPVIQTLMRPFSVQKIYKMASHFVQYYNKNSYHLETKHLAKESAVLRMTLTTRATTHFGPYRKACGKIWCQALRTGIAMVPKRTHNLPPAHLVDRACLAEGDEFCEWEVQWSQQTASSFTLAFPKNISRYVLKSEIASRERVIEEQFQALETRHEEIHKAYVEQQEYAIELQRHVDQLTTLHEVGIACASTLDLDTLLHNFMEMIIEKLNYDRVLIASYEPTRQVSHDFRILGVPPELAQKVRTLEIPVTDASTIEGTVLLEGTPLIVNEVNDIWDKLHPLHQELITDTNTQSFISVPLKVKNIVLGCLTVNKSAASSFKNEDLHIVMTVGNQIAIALQNAYAFREIETLNLSLENKVRDRTSELEHANEKLQKLDRVKTDFFNNVSHELRTPLTLTLGAFNNLVTLFPSKKAQERIDQGLRNTSRLLFLINELLDLAKIDSGRSTLHKQCFDLVKLIKDIASNFEENIWRRVVLRGIDRPIPIEADANQLKKVIFNLLSNAFKFTDSDNGLIVVKLREKESTIELAVEDNGIGIPQEEHKAIFERFSQVDGGTTRRFEGTGIGLALVKEIVTLHQGTIHLESEVNQGSTFTITLPRGTATVSNMVTIEHDSQSLPIYQADQLPSPLEPLDGGRSEHAASPRPVVLIVDDNGDMRAYLKRVLEQQYQIVEAQDGRIGLEKAQALAPDLILSDVMMPHMSGPDLLRAIRSHTALKTTPVIFLTARVGTEARIESFEAGADDYIQKPFDEQEILARVNNLIRARELERNVAKLQQEKLSRFLPVHVSEMVLSGNSEEFLHGHRTEISVLFIDLRGFTPFAETAAPEDLMNVLREYHREMGKLISEFEGTLERFSGDAMMVFFNDPIPQSQHETRAIDLSLAMKEQLGHLCREWSHRGIELGAGIGIASGYATLGLVGFEGRKDYAAIGSVTNLASRLCNDAQHGQILISERIYQATQSLIECESLGTVTLKGFHRPQRIYSLLRRKTSQQEGNLKLIK